MIDRSGHERSQVRRVRRASSFGRQPRRPAAFLLDVLRTAGPMRARHFFEGALVAVLFTSTCTGPRAAFPPTPSAHVRPQCGSWGVVDSPSSQGDGLQSVDVVAPNDAWAVGHRTGETPGPWIVRLDPSGWRTMQYPRAGGLPDGV